VRRRRASGAAIAAPPRHLLKCVTRRHIAPLLSRLDSSCRRPRPIGVNHRRAACIRGRGEEGQSPENTIDLACPITELLPPIHERGTTFPSRPGWLQRTPRQPPAQPGRRGAMTGSITPVGPRPPRAHPPPGLARRRTDRPDIPPPSPVRSGS